jgi:hypothetical protein
VLFKFSLTFLRREISVRPNRDEFSAGLDPAARPNDHQDHSAHNGCDAEEHK